MAACSDVPEARVSEDIARVDARAQILKPRYLFLDP